MGRKFTLSSVGVVRCMTYIKFPQCRGLRVGTWCQIHGDQVDLVICTLLTDRTLRSVRHCLYSFLGYQSLRQRSSPGISVRPLLSPGFEDPGPLQARKEVLWTSAHVLESLFTGLEFPPWLSTAFAARSNAVTSWRGGGRTRNTLDSRGQSAG